MSFREYLVARRRRLALVALGTALSLAAVGCSSDGASDQDTTTTSPGVSSTTSMVVTTTTTADSTVPTDTQDPGEGTAPEATDAPDGPTTVAGAERLREPSGTFLSSHRLSLSGNDGPSMARSVCHTTAGATCEITFSRNGMKVSLAAKEADAGGATSWDWSPAAMRMDAGHWDVEVTARLGGAEKSVADPIGLEVVD